MLSYTASVLALVGSALLVGQIPGLSLNPVMPMTEVDDWTNSSSPSALLENLLLHSEKLQDCNSSFILESSIKPNVSEPKFETCNHAV